MAAPASPRTAPSPTPPLLPTLPCGRASSSGRWFSTTPDFCPIGDPPLTPALSPVPGARGRGKRRGLPRPRLRLPGVEILFDGGGGGLGRLAQPVRRAG